MRNTIDLCYRLRVDVKAPWNETLYLNYSYSTIVQHTREFFSFVDPALWTERFAFLKEHLLREFNRYDLDIFILFHVKIKRNM